MKLSDFEKGQILAFYDTGIALRDIGRKINRSHNVVRNFITMKDEYGTKEKSGRLRVLSDRCKRRIQDLASNSTLCVRDIKTKVNTNASYSTVLRAIHANSNLVFKKMKQTPKLTEKHKEKRLNYAIEHIYWKKEWRQVVFSDEKKFNLDGPDGFKHYWHHINMEEISFSKRVMGGGGIMVWIGFCYNEKLTIQFIDQKMNSEKYCQMLDISLKGFLDDNKKNDYIFQQDNAPCHRARNTLKWFEESNISKVVWPALSPDLNPVENIWSDMSREIYSNGKQYNSLNELKNAILIAWATFPEEKLISYAKSMKKRMLDVIKNKGAKIDK